MGNSPSAGNKLTTQCVTTASLVILYYDYALTFSMEVQRFWTQRSFSWASFFFYLNRYLSLLGHIPVAMDYFLQSLSTAPDTCRHLQTYHQYFATAVQLVVGTLLIMRVYALYDRSRRVLAFLCVVASFVLAMGCFLVASGKKNRTALTTMSDIGCTHALTAAEQVFAFPTGSLTLTFVPSNRGVRRAVAWSGLLVFDIIVFGMTVAKAITIGKVGDRALINILLRDGSMYFFVIVLANLANILTFLLGGPYIRGVGTTFTNIISSVMISRLMFNLRSPSLIRRQTTMDTNLTTPATTDQPCVSTVIGPCESYGIVQLPPAKRYSRLDTPEDIELVSRSVSRWYYYLYYLAGKVSQYARIKDRAD